ALLPQHACAVTLDTHKSLPSNQRHTDRLLARREANDPHNDPLRQVSAAAKRASSLTRQLLMFSRKQPMQPKVLDLNTVLGNMAKMLRRLLGDDIVMELKWAQGVVAVEGDGGVIEREVMNGAFYLLGARRV